MSATLNLKSFIYDVIGEMKCFIYLSLHVNENVINFFFGIYRYDNNVFSGDLRTCKQQEEIVLDITHMACNGFFKKRFGTAENGGKNLIKWYHFKQHKLI